jgi:hypothetical protein
MRQTERLLIIPLSFGQLVKYIENNHSLEEELGGIGGRTAHFA